VSDNQQQHPRKAEQKGRTLNNWKTGGHGEVADRYYNSKEWYSMSPEKRRAVIALRDRRGDTYKKAQEEKHQKEYQKVAAIVVASLNANKTVIKDILPDYEARDNHIQITKMQMTRMQ